MDVNKYTVGWICALPLEMAAAIAMLDEDHGRPSHQAATDHNTYRLGQIGDHDVVLGCLPSGVYGMTRAVSVAVQMLASFPSIRIGLLVGIGGGAPSPEIDIRLGDVVISKPSSNSGGVIQHDMGRLIAGDFLAKGQLNKPPQVLLTAIANLEADHMLGDNRICEILAEVVANKKQKKGQKPFYRSPGLENDLLFQSDYIHTGALNGSCASCDPTRLVNRPPRDTGEDPQIHYGVISSANHIMQDGKMRDWLHRETGVICFETEAAGLMDVFPCLVIRGICDYADSHKNKLWQRYAAMRAAACAKELLLDAVRSQSNHHRCHIIADRQMGKCRPTD
ncbi:purine and uridine phosphorylase [Aspergillus cavernicola]|uniref:Purine and uridine phosphorylase n=1 Tax=Aspergillus cavernicola TaxID=176166 RepID=A0ABR4IFG7_9EURO